MSKTNKKEMPDSNSGANEAPLEEEELVVEESAEANADVKAKNAAGQPTEEAVVSDPVAEANAKADEYKDMLQRLQAEFDNFRKRNAESVKLARQDGGNEMIVAMLPILDSVDRALSMITDESTKVGVNLIGKMILDVFGKYGVKEIDAQGAEFDPSLHNAVMQVEDAQNAGKVVEVMQKGYTRNGKVIRYAMVKVAC